MTLCSSRKKKKTLCSRCRCIWSNNVVDFNNVCEFENCSEILNSLGMSVLGARGVGSFVGPPISGYFARLGCLGLFASCHGSCVVFVCYV